MKHAVVKPVVDWCANLFFPKRCLFCDGVTGFLQKCPACAPQVEQAVRVIGLPVGKEGHALDAVELALAQYQYRDPVKSAILRMKFSGDQSMPAGFAIGMAEQLAACETYIPCDLLVSVPSSRNELRSRGYDVPFLLAKALSWETGVPVCRGALRKVRETKRQIELSGEARRKNLIGAYETVKRQEIAGKRILLVDDVLTTGSTLNECAKALLGAGAAACCAVCIAVTKL